MFMEIIYRILRNRIRLILDDIDSTGLSLLQSTSQAWLPVKPLLLRRCRRFDHGVEAGIPASPGLFGDCAVDARHSAPGGLLPQLTPESLPGLTRKRREAALDRD